MLVPQLTYQKEAVDNGKLLSQMTYQIDRS